MECFRLVSLDVKWEVIAAQQATTLLMGYALPAELALFRERQEHPTSQHATLAFLAHTRQQGHHPAPQHVQLVLTSKEQQVLAYLALLART